MKCHIGVDAGSGLVHTTAEHDIQVQAAALIRKMKVVYGDAGYLESTGVACDGIYIQH